MANVLTANGEWEDDSQPSARTAEFLSATRFSFADACTLALKYGGEDVDEAALNVVLSAFGALEG